MTDQERKTKHEAMDNMTVWEVRKLAAEHYRAVIGNGHLFAIVPDNKKSTEKWEARRVEAGF